jgi:hypothetical protein
LLRFAAQPRRRFAALHYRQEAIFRRMTEAQARTLLRDKGCDDGLERWIAAQPWRRCPGGWDAVAALHGWRFRVTPAPPGVWITAFPPERATPAMWQVGD